MAKIARKADIEEPRPGKGTRSIRIESLIEGLKPHVTEIIIYGLVVVLLATGAYSRNRVWNSETELWIDCVKKSPHKERPHNNLGSALWRQGKPDEAMAHFAEAVRLKPDYAEAYNNLGIALWGQGKPDEAIVHFTEAVRIKPDYPKAHYNLGNAYLRIGNQRSALKEYEILKTTDPDLANALYQKIK